jgi:hypothetical protein
MDQLPDLRASCGDGNDDAEYWYFLWIHHVYLFLGFFYNESVPERAATLLHECRHIGGQDRTHDANFPNGSIYGEGTSGADSSWDFHGSWMFEALYLWWYYADGRNTNLALRERARQVAQEVIDNCFATHPGFTIR